MGKTFFLHYSKYIGSVPTDSHAGVDRSEASADLQAGVVNASFGPAQADLQLYSEIKYYECIVLLLFCLLPAAFPSRSSLESVRVDYAVHTRE